MKISIVSSYYNRRAQVINTLHTISKSKQVNNIEFILVNDCSSPEHEVDDLIAIFPFLKVINLKKEDRWYINPCVPFNIGFKEATGDVIVIQNPECLHMGDILDDLVNKINDDNYLTYAVYSITKEQTNFIHTLPFENNLIFQMIKAQLIPYATNTYVAEGHTCWYNHSQFRPAAYHFVSVITKKNLEDLGGFDERYANGIAFDDDEFLFRIRKKGLKVEIHDEPFAVHQWHYSENNFFAKATNPQEALSRNNNLFNNVTKLEKGWKVNG